MERDLQIEAIVGFVNRHPESLASRVIKRETLGGAYDRPDAEASALRDRLDGIDEETLTGYYYLVK